MASYFFLVLQALMQFLNLFYLQMYEKYRDYATEAEREDLASKLQETEDWLYEDGEDETKGVYVAKLAELKNVCIHYGL